MSRKHCRSTSLKIQLPTFAFGRWSSCITWKMTHCRYLSPSKTTRACLRHVVTFSACFVSLAKSSLILQNMFYPQGTLLRRHKVKITDSSSATGSHTASPEDFRIGETLPVYGITYLITDADGFTRNWFRDNRSCELGAPVATPDDPSATLKASRSRNKGRLGPPSPRTDDLARFNEARLGKPSNVLDSDSLRQFLVRDLSLCFLYPWQSSTSF